MKTLSGEIGFINETAACVCGEGGGRRKSMCGWGGVCVGGGEATLCGKRMCGMGRKRVCVCVCL